MAVFVRDSEPTMPLATTLCGVELEHPLMNAAGTCKTAEQAVRFAESAVSAVVIGSITVEERPVNSGNTYASHPSGSYSLLNAMGLPNPGSAYYREHLPAMCAAITAAGKYPIVSVVGFSPEEYAELAELAYASEAWLVEINLGCPNVWGDGGQKPIPSFYPEMIEAIIEAVYDRLDPTRFGVKLSPRFVRKSVPSSGPTTSRTCPGSSRAATCGAKSSAHDAATSRAASSSAAFATMSSKTALTASSTTWLERQLRARTSRSRP